MGNSNLALIGRGLSLLVEAHHHDGGTIAHHIAGMADEDILAFLKRDGIDDALALAALQCGSDDIPARRINHNRYARDIGLGSNQLQEMRHFLAGIEQSVVHVDINHHGAVTDLLAGYGDSFIVLLLLDQSQELPTAGHIAALTHIDEAHLGRDVEAFESAQPESLTAGVHLVGLLVLGGKGETTDELIGGATAAAYDVHQSLVHNLCHLGRHRLRSLVVEPHGVGQAGIGIDADIIRRGLRQLPEEGHHLAGTERTVQAERENIVGADTCQECLQRLPAQRASGEVADRGAHHDGQVTAESAVQLLAGINGGLGIQRVEDGLDDEGVYPTPDERLSLFGVGIEEFIIGQVAGCRIANIGRHGAGLVGRPYAACHEAGLLFSGELISRLTGESGACFSNVGSHRLQVVVGL